MAMELLEHIEVGSGGVSSIAFQNIPQDGIDLLILLEGQTSNAQVWGDLLIRVNNISSSQYDWKNAYVFGTSIYSDYLTSRSEIRMQLFGTAGTTELAHANTRLYFTNYTSGTKKPMFVDGSYGSTGSSKGIGHGTGYSSNTGAITSLELYPRSGYNFTQYTIASLYKIS